VEDHRRRSGDLERLAAVRPFLLDLHRELLAAARADLERFGGRLTAAEFLQIATDGLRLAWLSPLSELIVEIDETLEAESGDPAEAPSADDAKRLIDRARALVAPPSGETPFGRRYVVMLQQSPAVVMAHSALLQQFPSRP
jgi:hypothetical protein